jgi:hypothetical protein
MRVMRACFAAPIMAWSNADPRRRVSETKLEELAPAGDLILERRGQQPRQATGFSAGNYAGSIVAGH